MACRAHLGEVQKRYQDIRTLGGQVLVVSFAPPEKASAYLARHPITLPIVTDPTREAYRAFELGRTSWSSVFGPLVLARYVKLILNGWLPQKSQGEGDLLQLGGDFILDGRRRIVYSYYGKDPTDRPSAQELLEIVRGTV
jgi:peroxiredoxin